VLLSFETHNPEGKTMKKVLLATSALFLTAGVASAEITFSGKAEAGVVSTKSGSTAGVADGANTKAKVYSGYDFNVAGTATTDSGMSLSMGFDMGAGEMADIADEELDTQGATVATSAVTISYNGLTLGLGDNKFDDLYDDTQNGDVSVSGEIGGLTVAIVSDADADKAAAGAVAAEWNGTSYNVGYKIGDVTLGMKGTQHNDDGDAASVISAGYTMGDVTITLSRDDKGKAKDVNKVAVSYSAGGVTLSGSATDAKVAGKKEWDASVAYTAGAVTIKAETDESDSWAADVAYDLGGATAFAMTNKEGVAIAGVSFAF
jgi:outer membrane protein OmpU